MTRRANELGKSADVRPRRRLSRADRRRELLDAALAVFASRGIGEARHAQVAEAAGCAVSTVFVYFPTREDLVGAVLGEVERFLVEMAERIHASDRAVPHVLRAHVDAFVAAVAAEPDLVRVWLDWSTAFREDYWARYIRLQERVVALIAATLKRGQHEGTVVASVDPDEDARLLVGSAHMLAQMALTGRPAAKIRRFVDTLIGAVVGHGGGETAVDSEAPD